MSQSDQDWINVADRLPSDDELIEQNGWYMIMYYGTSDDEYYPEQRSWQVLGWASPDIVRIRLMDLATHWMPLPEPPE